MLKRPRAPLTVTRKARDMRERRELDRLVPASPFPPASRGYLTRHSPVVKDMQIIEFLLREV